MGGRDVLKKLIESPDAVSREEAIVAITDMFMADGYEPNAVEAARYSDIVAAVIDKLAIELKREIAAKVSATDRITHELAIHLSQAEIEVAAPLLRNSPLLTDEDLVRVTRERSMEHRLAISDRSVLSEAVTDALTEVGEALVLQRVASNDGAAFSALGFRQLVERGGGDEKVQSALARRATANPAFAGSLHDALSEELRAKLGPVLDVVSDQRLSSIMGVAAVEAEEAIKDRMRARLELKVILKEINSQARSVDQAIAGLANQNRLTDLGWLISELLQLPEPVVTATLRREDRTSLAFLLKALAVQPATFGTVLAGRARRFGFDEPGPAAAAAEYQAIPLAVAQRAVRVLKLQRAVAG